MDRVSRLMRVVPSSATCVPGLVGFMTASAHTKSGHVGIYTKLAFCGSGIAPNPSI
jgi:hypothetical protein